MPVMATQWPICKIARPGDRGQARSYRDLYWLADLVGAGLPAMASLRSGGTTEVQRIASKLAPTGVCGGWRILWELACQRWHLCGLEERPRCSGSRASSLLQVFVVAGGSCGSWLVSDGISAVWRNDRGAADREQARSYRCLWWLADLVGAGLSAMASLRSGNVRKTLNPGAGDTPGCLLWRFQQLAASRCLVATTICGMHCAEILWRSSPLTLPCWEASRSAQS